MPSLTFRGAKDRVTTGITLAVWSIPVVLGIAARLTAFGSPGFVAAAGIAACIAFVAAWAPRDYRLTDGALEIRRWVGPRTIPWAGVTSVELADPRDLEGMWRVAGVGGLHGYFGAFATERLGSVEVWATARPPWVLLRRADDEPLLVSPAEPDAFVAAARRRLRSSPG